MSFEFVYVIFLERADGHKIGDEFPKYFKYQYGADTDILAQKALENNHLSKSNNLYNVEKSKVSEIKIILKKHCLKVSGRKKDLIERIAENLTEEDIKSDFPDSYYTLTDNGRNFVKENDHIIYYHKSQNLTEIPIEIYHELLKDNNDTNLKYEIALELLDKNASKERENRNWGLYRNSLLSKAYVYEDINEYKLALDHYLKICIIDLSGLSNGNHYMPESIILAPGIINFIKRSLSKLELDAENIKKEYYSIVDKLNLPKTALTKEESFEYLIENINNN